MSLPTSANLSLSQINSVMRFTNGNLGIGTTAPSYNLDIAGNINANNLLKLGSNLLLSFNPIVAYNTTATLTTTTPTDIEVSGHTDNVTIALPSNNTSGNIITIYNLGNTTGNIRSSVFVRMGTSTTSGSLARLNPGESVITMALQTAGTTPRAYQDTITRKSALGNTWTERSIPTARNWQGISWSPELGLFCATNYGSAAVIMTSPDSVNWTERSIPNNRNWWGIAWSSELGLFCSVNYGSAAFVMTSPNGVTWTERSIPASRNWSSVCWASELALFCAVNYGSAAVVMTSPDGVTWTERSIPGTRNWQSVCWAPELGLFCAVNEGSAAVVMTSADGVTWTERSIPTNRNWESVCWSSPLGLFCAVNNGSAAVVMTSPDGITWTERNIPNNRNWLSICWSNEYNIFCAVNNGNAAVLMTSLDGINWIERSIPSNRALRSICWSSELMTFCALDYNTAAYVLTSFGVPLNLQIPVGTSMGTTSTLTNNTVTYTLSTYFKDYTYAGLTYTLTANPNSSASLSNGILSVTGYYRNSTYTVTVTATNTFGKTATSSLAVVEAASPTPTATSMGSTSSLTTNTVTYTLSSYFTDSTGTGLTYSLTANPQSSASILNGILSVAGNYRNSTYTVTVRATNGYGGFSSSSLSVTEANGAPTASGMGTTSTLTTNTVQYTLSSYFTAPSGTGTITYSLVSNPYGNASISSGILYVTGNNRGTSYTVTVRGTNSYGSSDSSLSVTEQGPVTFTQRSTPNSNSHYAICRTANYFYVFNYGSSNTAIRSSDGITWTQVNLTGNSRLYQIAVSDGNNRIILGTNGESSLDYTTNEGTSWLTQSTTAGRVYVGGAYINGTWAFPLYNAALVAYGGPGSLNHGSIPNNRNWTAVAWSGSLAVAVNNAGGAFVMTATNATSWTERAIPNNRSWWGITWSPSLALFCAVGYGNVVMTSSNGTNWTERTVTNRNWFKIAWSGTRFVAITSDSSNIIMSSSDGINWVESTLPGTYSLNNIIPGTSSGTFVAVGNSGVVLTGVIN